MKKLIIASFVAALFAACNNTPAVNESTTNVAKLTSWVDSIKTVITSATTHDSATWASYNEQYNAVVGTIKVEELDEATKATFATAQESWTAVGTGYTELMNKEKEAAAAAAAAADTATLLEKAG
ncbi:MAG: hypothetical protein V4613_04110, partial [Bacteroidota bacterium]